MIAGELRAKLLRQLRGQAGLRGDAPNHTPAHQAPLVWRAPEGPEGLAAVPVGGGRARADNESTRRAHIRDLAPPVRRAPVGWRAWLRCPWAAAGPGRTTSQRAEHTSETWHRRCGGRRWDGGPGCGARGRWRGLAGQRGDAPSEARGADGSRAGRRPRAHQAARPNNTPRGAQNTSGATRHLGTTKPPSPTGAGRLR